MIPLATTRAAQPSGNPMLASIYAGVLTALIAYAAVYFLQSDNLVLFGVALLLTGIGPVLGYAFASGRVGVSIPGLIGGIIGSIIPLVSVLLWPILVGAFTRTQSVGKLLLGSIRHGDADSTDMRSSEHLIEQHAKRTVRRINRKRTHRNTKRLREWSGSRGFE